MCFLQEAESAVGKLTKRTVDALEPRAADYFEWDADLAGFGVRVWPTGKKVYLVQYRADARTRRVKLGSHGALTVEEARKAAKVVLGDVARGEDPAEDKATRRRSLTVAELCESYLTAAKAGLIMGKRGRSKKASTLATDGGRIARHIVPLLGTKLVRDVAAADVNRFIRDVTAGKTATVEKTGLRGKAVVEGGAGTAARTAGLLGGIFTFAVSEGVIATNPCQGVRRPAGKRRKRRITPAEYRRLGDTLRAVAADASESDQAVAGAWLMALTGCRSSEIVLAKWAELDEEAGCCRFGDTKEGESLRPFGKAAFSILAKVKRRAGCLYVLPAARSDGPYGGMPGAWERIAARAGFENITLHTLRHGFASIADELGYTESTVAALLGHAKGSVTSGYIHHLDAVLVAAADRVSAEVAASMGVSSHQP